MKAVNKFIVIDQINEQVKTSSGLIMSGEDMIGIRYRKAKVLTPGNEVSTVLPGDVIYYDSSSGHSVMIEGVLHTIIQERDVVVVLD